MNGIEHHIEKGEGIGDDIGDTRRALGNAELAALIAELFAASAEFRRIWATGEVVMCAAGRKALRHPSAGLLTLDYETLHVPAAPGQTGLVVHVFSAEEGSQEAAALTRLATVAHRTATAG